MGAGWTNDDKYNTEVSNMLGLTTIKGSGKNISEHGESKSEHDMGRLLMTPDEMRRLPRDEYVGLLDGKSARFKKPFKVVDVSGGKDIRFY